MAQTVRLVGDQGIIFDPSNQVAVGTSGQRGDPCEFLGSSSYLIVDVIRYLVENNNRCIPGQSV